MGWLSLWILGSGALAVLTFFGVLIRERRAPHPVIPAVLSRNVRFWKLNGAGFMFNFVIFGEVFLLSLFLQQAQDKSALATGASLLSLMCVIPIGNFVSGYLANFWNGQAVLVSGLSCAALGSLAATVLGTQVPFWLFSIPVAAGNFGMAMAITAMISGVIHEAGSKQANVASATLNANRQVGALAGVATIGIFVHQFGDWPLRMRSGFGAFLLCIVLAFFFVLTSRETRSDEVMVGAKEAAD